MEPYGQIVGDASVALNFRRSWMICHVKREANAAAHELARAAVKTPMDRIWIEDIPSCIFDLVNLERLAL
jgi:hypothetical protein